MAPIVSALMTLAMRMARGQFRGAAHDERAPERRGCAEATDPKPIATPAGPPTLAVPKTGEPCHPQALARGRRSCRALMLAVAEMSLVRCRDPRRRAGSA
jgi:putative transposase